MNARRPLGETLSDVARGVLDTLAAARQIGVKSMTVRLPVEIECRDCGNGIQLLGDVPRMVTRTAFDPLVSRLEVVWEMGEPS